SGYKNKSLNQEQCIPTYHLFHGFAFNFISRIWDLLVFFFQELLLVGHK
ncbi:unnamed protein product, partial [Arabidopsis halleri]